MTRLAGVQTGITTGRAETEAMAIIIIIIMYKVRKCEELNGRKLGKNYLPLLFKYQDPN